MPKLPRRTAAAPPPAQPFVIAAEGQKGGAGKSTLTASLGDEALRRGLRVLFVDADPQATLMEWAAAAARNGRPAPRVIATHEPHREAGKFAGHDVVLIDCPGRLDLTQKSALLVADVALLPCVPSPLDLWALKESVRLVRVGQKIRPALQLHLVLNRMTRAFVAQATAATIRGAGASVLSAELGQRAVYAEALDHGAGPASFAPRSAAALEVRALFDELLSHRRAACESSEAASARL